MNARRRGMFITTAVAAGFTLMLVGLGLRLTGYALTPQPESDYAPVAPGAPQLDPLPLPVAPATGEPPGGNQLPRDRKP